MRAIFSFSLLLRNDTVAPFVIAYKLNYRFITNNYLIYNRRLRVFVSQDKTPNTIVVWTVVYLWTMLEYFFFFYVKYICR